MPLISILVPIYNVEAYLKQCLDSICAQTLKDIEIICVNDGSTDSSNKIVTDFSKRDNRIRLIHKANTGYGNTMNIALQYASGEYIGIVESDDFISNNMYESLYEKAKYMQADVVKSNYFIYQTNPEKVEILEVLHNCKYNEIFSPLDELEIFDIQPSIWSGIYKRDLILDNNINFLETPGASFQDTSFAFKVWLHARKVYLLKDAFLYYRCDNPDASVKSIEKAFCICEEFNEIERYLCQNKLYKEKVLQYFYRRKYRAYEWNYFRLKGALQELFLDKLKYEFKQDILCGNISENEWPQELWNNMLTLVKL